MKMEDHPVRILVPEPMNASPSVYDLRARLHRQVLPRPSLKRYSRSTSNELKLNDVQARRQLSSEGVLNVAIQGSSAF